MEIAMRLEWIIDNDDIARVKAFYERHRENPFVRLRIERNLRTEIVHYQWRNSQQLAIPRSRRVEGHVAAFGTGSA